jgi:5-formyltetrahydrofolate cyclo-ligase
MSANGQGGSALPSSRSRGHVSDPSSAEKASLRRDLIRRRAAFHAAGGAEAGLAVRRRVLDEVTLPPGAVVSAYWPLDGELDPRPLMEELARRGHPLALPRLDGDDRPLALHRWQPGDPLIPGAFQLEEPDASLPAAAPDVLLVPLVGFDREGYRLGYGKGYYDRTLRALRAQKPILAIGLAYAVQRIESLPRHEGDEPLDLVATEERLYDFRSGAAA